jgi:hypothetical protein
MILLRMMLRLFTSIFGATHPTREEEDKYAWMLLGLIVSIVFAMGAMMLLVMRFVR